MPQILRADSLASGDESGLSDPYFSVEWAGQRFTTRVKRATLNPVFNETLYFHVRPCVRSRGCAPLTGALARFAPSPSTPRRQTCCRTPW